MVLQVHGTIRHACIRWMTRMACMHVMDVVLHVYGGYGAARVRRIWWMTRMACMYTVPHG